MRLSLFFLGPFQVTLDNEPTVFATDRARALLAYLAVEAERPHRREALAALLWPDRPESAARQNLSQALVRLRRAINDYHASPPFLLITAKTVQFNAASAELDVARFETLLAACAAHPHPHVSSCPPCLERLEEAAGLYRGEFLQGLFLADSQTFEEWNLFKREQLHRQALDVLHTLTLHYERWGAHEQAGRYAARQLALEPWREEAHRQLMQALAMGGQRGAALAQYETCCRVLADELGVEPMSETTALYEQIRDEQIGPWADVPKSLYPPGPPPPQLPTVPPPLPATPPAPSPSAPFVTRERELARLDELLDTALAGRGQVVFVTGEAGTGRTALTREFARRAQGAHADLIVASGNCNAQTSLGDPYLPFREALSLLTGDIQAKWAGGMITQENASRLWAFVPLSVPTLVELGPDLIDSFVSGTALLSRTAAFAPSGAVWLAQLEQVVTRHMAGQGPANLQQNNLFEQYTAVLGALAAQRPLLLLLDDLHWADPSSVSLLFHLGRRIGGSRILLVGTYRPEDVAVGWTSAAHPLAGVISEFKRDFGDIEVNLDQATGVEGRRFVDALLDTEPNRLDETFRQVLFQHTGGHALFTIELLRDMQERGDLVKDQEGQWVEGPPPRPAGAGQGGLDWNTLPARVEGVIERRVGRLPRELQQALRVASVEGEEFTAEVVARVQGVDEEELIRRLSAEVVRQHRLLSAPSLQWLGPQPLSRYHFRHHMFQQYLYHTLDEVERAHLHAAVGSAMENLYGNQTEQATVQEPMAPLRLAWHFQAAGMVDKAANYLLQAGERTHRLSANEEAITHLNQGLALLKALPDTIERAQRELALLIPLGNALIAVRGYAAPEVGQTYRRARELCRQMGDAPELFPVLSGLHRFFLARGEEQMVRDLGEQFAYLAQNESDPELLTEAHRALGATLWFQGKFATAQAHFEEGISLYQPQHHPTYVRLYGEDPGVTCLSYAAWALWLLGYPDQALKRGQEALSLARELAHPFSLAEALSFTAALHQFREEGQAVQAQAEAAIALSTEHGFPFWLTAGTVLRGWAMARQCAKPPEAESVEGQGEEGLAQIRQGLSAWGAMGIEVGQLYYLALLAEAYGNMGQAEAGLKVLAEVLPMVSGIRRWWEPELYRLNGELLRKAKDRRPVLSAVEGVKDEGNGGSPADSSPEACFLQAIDIARRQQAKSLELRAVMSLSRLWHAQGKRAEARQMLAEIYGWFTEGYDTADLKAARALLEALV